MSGPSRRPDFLPTTAEEMLGRGWDQLDVLLVSGDAYVDHPAFGVPLLGRLLEEEGYRVGIVAQPDWKDPDSFKAMGRPRLFVGISSGAMDSMVNHYTAAKRRRSDDAYTPGGRAGARPDRAVIAYTAGVKGAFKGVPTVIGGIEASLRRLAHYDHWDDAVRRSVLVDSKADLLVFGMAERVIIQIARRLAGTEEFDSIRDLPGTAFITKGIPDDAVVLPSFEQAASDPEAFSRAFCMAEEEGDPYHGRRLAQPHGDRTVVVNRPAPPLTTREIDRIYSLPFSRDPHPRYTEPIPAAEQIRFSVTGHRGCFGGCAFCALSAHQGRTIQSRSPESLRQEVDRIASHPRFRGTVTDVGGPTANMYGSSCGAPRDHACRRRSCLHPARCPHLRADGRAAARLLRDLRRRPGVRHLFVASGVRHDLVLGQPEYLDELIEYAVGGLMKVAPETAAGSTARAMRKPGPEAFGEFVRLFRSRSRALGKRQAVVPYFMSAHPGSTIEDMVETALFLRRHNLRVEQVQEFTPTPGTLASCVYHTGRDPYTGEPVHVPRSARERRLQKALLLWHLPEHRRDVELAVKECGREDALAELYPGSPAGKGRERMAKSAHDKKRGKIGMQSIHPSRPSRPSR